MSRTALTRSVLAGFTGIGGIPPFQSLTKLSLNLVSSMSMPPTKGNSTSDRHSPKNLNSRGSIRTLGILGAWHVLYCFSSTTSLVDHLYFIMAKRLAQRSHPGPERRRLRGRCVLMFSRTPLDHRRDAVLDKSFTRPPLHVVPTRCRVARISGSSAPLMSAHLISPWPGFLNPTL